MFNINRLSGIAWLLALFIAVGAAFAQVEHFSVRDIVIVTGADVYGQIVKIAEGTLVNDGDAAVGSITLTAAVYNTRGEQAGEGIGYPVNACGAGLPGLVMSPGTAHKFAVPLELYEQNAGIDRVEISVSGFPAEPPPPLPEVAGVTRISDREVVTVEWLDSKALRFGVGCARDGFTALDWQMYSARTGILQTVIHPNNDDVTQTLRERIRLTDPALFAHSFLSFAPDGRRIVYQDEVNRFWTAEPNGALQRMMYDELHNRTLQRIYWLPGARFVAYYYGAYGDPVLYFTGDEEGRAISRPPSALPPSEIEPGVSPDGRRAVIAGTFDDVTGYFLKTLTNAAPPELLFEAPPAGNNYPPPLFRMLDDGREQVYLIRPLGDAARLQCYDLLTANLSDLAPMPLRLAADERATAWLAPDGRTIALAADGINSGLWLIDLTAFPAC